MARGQKGPRFGQGFLGGAAARLGHDAIGTTVDTAILDLEDGPRATEGPDAERRIALKGLFPAGIRPWAVQKARLCLIAQAEIRLCPRGAGTRPECLEKPRRTARKKNARLRRGPADAEDGIARIPFRPRSDGATVDQDDIRRVGHRDGAAATRLPALADRLAFVLVDLATKCHDMECPGSHAPLCMQKPPP